MTLARPGSTRGELGVCLVVVVVAFVAVVVAVLVVNVTCSAIVTSSEK